MKNFSSCLCVIIFYVHGCTDTSQSDLRIEKMRQQYLTASGRSSIQLPPIPPVLNYEDSSTNDSSNKIQSLATELEVARDEISALKVKRNAELHSTLLLTQKFQEAIHQIKLKSVTRLTEAVL